MLLSSWRFCISTSGCSDSSSLCLVVPPPAFWPPRELGALLLLPFPIVPSPDQEPRALQRGRREISALGVTWGLSRWVGLGVLLSPPRASVMK